jgi:hypothetical protein
MSRGAGGCAGAFACCDCDDAEGARLPPLRASYPRLHADCDCDPSYTSLPVVIGHTASQPRIQLSAARHWLQADACEELAPRRHSLDVARLALQGLDDVCACVSVRSRAHVAHDHAQTSHAHTGAWSAAQRVVIGCDCRQRDARRTRHVLQEEHLQKRSDHDHAHSAHAHETQRT